MGVGANAREICRDSAPGEQDNHEFEDRKQVLVKEEPSNFDEPPVLHQEEMEFRRHSLFTPAASPRVQDIRLIAHRKSHYERFFDLIITPTLGFFMTLIDKFVDLITTATLEALSAQNINDCDKIQNPFSRELCRKLRDTRVSALLLMLHSFVIIILLFASVVQREDGEAGENVPRPPKMIWKRIPVLFALCLSLCEYMTLISVFHSSGNQTTVEAVADLEQKIVALQSEIDQLKKVGLRQNLKSRSLKSVFGLYLSALENGYVEWNKMLPGKLENFEVLSVDGGFVFRSYWDTYLSARNGRVITCDANNVTKYEVFDLARRDGGFVFVAWNQNYVRIGEDGNALCIWNTSSGNEVIQVV
jgi:uncharacterized small protein (DUF1192 family)